MVSGKLLLGSPAAQIFLREVGITVDPLRDLDAFKLACEQANDRYKGGKDLVRFELEIDRSRPTIGIEQATLNLAGKLGMMHGETPITGDWDVILALGGARRSPYHRACYAAQAIVEGRADAKILAIGGSTRELRPAEIPLVQDFAPGAITEFDLCQGAAGKILERYPKLNVITVCKDDARSGNDGVIDQTVLDCQNLGDKPLRVVAVTTRIYVIGLELDMARAAKRHGWKSYGAAGHSSDPEMVFNRSILTYLSECLTTLRKAAIAAAEVAKAT